MTPLSVSFRLLTEDQGLVLSTNLVPFDSNQFMLCPWAMSFFQKWCPAPFFPVTEGPIPLLRWQATEPQGELHRVVSELSLAGPGGPRLGSDHPPTSLKAAWSGAPLPATSLGGFG